MSHLHRHPSFASAEAMERHIDSVKRIVASLVVMPTIIMPLY